MFGETTLHLPKGTYTVFTIAFSGVFSWLIAPRQPLTADATLVADSRSARPVDVMLPDPSVTLFDEIYRYQDTANSVGDTLLAPIHTKTAELGPAASPGEIHSLAQVTFATGSTRRRRCSTSRTSLPTTC
jgi:hypothetical protein